MSHGRRGVEPGRERARDAAVELPDLAIALSEDVNGIGWIYDYRNGPKQSRQESPGAIGRGIETAQGAIIEIGHVDTAAAIYGASPGTIELRALENITVREAGIRAARRQAPAAESGDGRLRQCRGGESQSQEESA